MSAIAQRINMGVAACALAAAATLAPVTVANADTTPAPTSSVGSKVGSAVVAPAVSVDSGSDCDDTGANNCSPDTVSPAASPGAGANSSHTPNLFQNNLWWFGAANPNPPPRSTIFEFEPLTLVPGFLRPAYGWFTQNLNFEACIGGGSVKVGPYGSTTVSVGRGCA